MANAGQGFFNAKGEYFKTPAEATKSDIAALLGRLGEGESLAPGIANAILEKRGDLERILAEHDAMEAGMKLTFLDEPHTDNNGKGAE